MFLLGFMDVPGINRLFKMQQSTQTQNGAVEALGGQVVLKQIFSQALSSNRHANQLQCDVS